tara:strand:+ start:82 stop:579 length:498 start_codon:yes stop_codon:yes gene_type:complete
MTEKKQTYGRAQIIVHWLTLLLLPASYLSGEAMDTAWRVILRGHGAFFTPGIGVRVHVFAGLTVLALTLLRLWLRLRHGAPPPVDGQHPLVTIASASGQGLMYLLLLALPITGLATWYGGVVALAPVHVVLFFVTLALIVAHILGAVFRHLVIGDGSLARMGWWR